MRVASGSSREPLSATEWPRGARDATERVLQRADVVVAIVQRSPRVARHLHANAACPLDSGNKAGTLRP